MKNIKPATGFLRVFDKKLLSNKKFNIKDTIIVSGTPRSGSTLLMEILATIPSYTYMFEPLNPIWFKESFEKGFRSRTYLSEEQVWSDGEEYLKKVFTGKVFSSEPAYKPRMGMVNHRVFGNKLVVKSVNFNRLLPWISKKFQTRHIFLIIRNPCAVISSQLKTEFFGYRPDKPPFMDIFPTIENINNEIKNINWLDEKILNVIKRINTKEEILAAVWCLDNYIPLLVTEQYRWTPVIYERLINDGEKEIVRIFDKIGEKIPRSTDKHLKEASLSTLKEDKKIVTEKDEQLYKWKKTLSNEQVENILRIVKDFGFNFYLDDKIPDYDDIFITR